MPARGWGLIAHPAPDIRSSRVSFILHRMICPLKATDGHRLIRAPARPLRAHASRDSISLRSIAATLSTNVATLFLKGLDMLLEEGVEFGEQLYFSKAWICSLRRALSLVSSLRATAIRATLAGLPFARSSR